MGSVIKLSFPADELDSKRSKTLFPSSKTQQQDSENV